MLRQRVCVMRSFGGVLVRISRAASGVSCSTGRLPKRSKTKRVISRAPSTLVSSCGNNRSSDRSSATMNSRTRRRIVAESTTSVRPS